MGSSIVAERMERDVWKCPGWSLRGGILLALALLAGCTPTLARTHPEIVVLYTREEPIIPHLPAHCCEYLPLEGFQPEAGRTARTVIVAGHGQPPEYAGHTFQQVADAVATFHPRLVVMNSCYGASTDILGALTAHRLDAYVVAAPFPIYKPGFVYDPAFFTGTLQEQLMAVHTDPAYPLLRWKLQAQDLQTVEAAVKQLPKETLLKRLRRVKPALVRMPLATPFEAHSEILVPLPPERFR